MDSKYRLALDALLECETELAGIGLHSELGKLLDGLRRLESRYQEQADNCAVRRPPLGNILQSHLPR